MIDNPASRTIDRDPVLRRFKTAVATTYGDRLDRVLLFGSRARGDARDDSDYDLAVFLKDTPECEKDRVLLADIGFDILEQDGNVINAMPFSISSLAERTPLMHEIRRDGIEI